MSNFLMNSKYQNMSAEERNEALTNNVGKNCFKEGRISIDGWSDDLFQQDYMEPLIKESLTKPDLDTRKHWAVAFLDFYATGEALSRLDATEIMKYFLLTWTIEGKIYNQILLIESKQ